MNILIQLRDTGTDKELKEFTEDDGNEICISHSTEESINQLSARPFNKAVISLKSLQDIAILKYLNDYYPDIKIVVIANKTFDDIISTFQKVNYSVIHEPLQLSELKNQLTVKLKPA
jgi:DNA-binding NtrC family response regulator